MFSVFYPSTQFIRLQFDSFLSSHCFLQNLCESSGTVLSTSEQTQTTDGCKLDGAADNNLPDELNSSLLLSELDDLNPSSISEDVDINPDNLSEDQVINPNSLSEDANINQCEADDEIDIEEEDLDPSILSETEEIHLFSSSDDGDKSIANNNVSVSTTPKSHIIVALEEEFQEYVKSVEGYATSTVVDSSGMLLYYVCLI